MSLRYKRRNRVLAQVISVRIFMTQMLVKIINLTLLVAFLAKAVRSDEKIATMMKKIKLMHLNYINISTKEILLQNNVK